MLKGFVYAVLSFYSGEFSKMGARCLPRKSFRSYGRYFSELSSFVDRVGSGFLTLTAIIFDKPSLVKFEKFVFPLHYGAGATVGVFGSSVLLGANFPVGLNYAFMDGKLDVALEAALGITVVPYFNFGVTGGVSVVYYFD